MGWISRLSWKNKVRLALVVLIALTSKTSDEFVTRVITMAVLSWILSALLGNAGLRRNSSRRTPKRATAKAHRSKSKLSSGVRLENCDAEELRRERNSCERKMNDAWGEHRDAEHDWSKHGAVHMSRESLNRDQRRILERSDAAKAAHDQFKNDIDLIDRQLRQLRNV